MKAFIVRKRWGFLYVCVQVVLLVMCSPLFAQPMDTDGSVMQLISPAEGSLVVGKRPAVQVNVKGPFKPDNMLVYMDDTDVTGILEQTVDGFSFTPLQVLRSGQHTVTVVLYTDDGQQIQKEFFFSSRHTETFEEAYTDNELSGTYESVLRQPEDWDEPYSRLSGNLRSDTIIKKGNWAFGFNANARYYDQSLPVESPIWKGFSLNDYNVNTHYLKDDVEFAGEFGDVSVNETYNTVSLARKGGTTAFRYKDLILKGFIVDGKEVYGFRNARDGTGIEGTLDENVMGGSIEAGILDRRVVLKSIYVTGGEQEDSFGTFEDDRGKKGDVVGFVLNTDFFEGKLRTEAEADFARYDDDTSDEVRKESDYTYFVKVGGAAGIFSYEALREYTGPEYQTIGNINIPNDTERYRLSAGASFEVHAVSFAVSRYNDNVEQNAAYARVYTYEGRGEYYYSGLSRVPISFSYAKIIGDSTMEPIDTDPFRLDEDTATGTIGYNADAWDVGFETTYSLQDDRTRDGADTEMTTHSIYSSFTFEHVRISPSFSYNNIRYEVSGTRFVTYTGTLGINGEIPNTPVTYSLASTYNRSKATDGSDETDSVNGSAQITYALGKHFLDCLNPVIDLNAQYIKSNSREPAAENDTVILLLIFSTSIPFMI